MNRLRYWTVIATTFLLTIASIGLIWSQRTAVGDWAALQGYSPPAEIEALARDTTMTDRAKRLFYINQPDIEGREEFNQSCPNMREKALVLGCFRGNRLGIHIFKVDNQELHGVEQVTAAHEMLHQAFERLNEGERKRLGKLLEEFASSQLKDESVKEQLDEYRESEPDHLINEMHSLFATEVTKLTPELEDYYDQYFTDRKVVADFYHNYQAAFQTRQDKIAAFDAQLADLESEIDSLKQSVEDQFAALEQKKQQLDADRAAGNIEEYNAQVDPYNAMVDRYNSDIEILSNKIDTYNEIVAQRNALAFEQRQLQQELSSKPLPTSTDQ